MKYLEKIIMVSAGLCLVMMMVSQFGCSEQLTPQPKFYSEAEKHIMYIPKGCKIGDISAPEDGIFIGKSRILDMRIIEVPRKQDIPMNPRIPGKRVIPDNSGKVYM